MVQRVRVVGDGRAGGSFANALRSVGVDVEMRSGRGAQPAADACDLVLICVADDAISEVAAATPPGDAVVGHCSGSRRLDVLAPHSRTCSVHPLMSLPTPDIGAERLLDNCYLAVAGDDVARQLVERLGGRAFAVADDDRATYHATASIAANHLVALAAQVEQLADVIGVEPDGFWAMMRTALANVEEIGATAALTGPAARGDWGTIVAHLEALDRVDAATPSEGPSHRARYLTLAAAAAAMAGSELPTDLTNDLSPQPPVDGG